MQRKFLSGAAVAVLTATTILTGGVRVGAGGSSATQESGEQQFVVLYTEGASAADAHAAIAAAGGTIVSENTDIGVATISTTNADFAATAEAQPSIEGTALNRIIADVPDDTVGAETKKYDAANADIASLPASSPALAPAAPTARTASPAAEPLASLQWDMQQIGATSTGSYKYEQGKGVRVGIIDTGVDGSHPDIAPNFDAALSRNFTTDIPYDANGDVIDGPCEDEPDQSCSDPADVDEDGHGTHVASTIAAPINGIGIAGVAPKATIVNLRAGQDSGYFFVQPTVDALTYAGKNGIDVVNMSFYVDPWLFNCSNNPSDSPADQAEQVTIVTAVQRALTFARRHGVTLVAAAGNGATDYTKELVDASSPDFADVPGEVAYTRDLVDPASCISMPSEGAGVISVSSTGPSLRKSYYSDYGNGYIDVAAPGGDAYDTPTNDRDLKSTVLAAYPKALALASGFLDADGNPLPGSPVVKSCDAAGTTCGYYQYLQGTSMASPHAAGVAALIVGRFGLPDFRNGGKFLPPDVVEFVLKATAKKTACPVPPAYTYTRNVPQPDGSIAVRTTTHVCEGTKYQNGFYGNGVVNALSAIGK